MKKTFFTTKKQSTAGFTLVELLVSLALFTIAITISISSLYTVDQAAKRVQAMRTVLDNLNFAMESMSRNIRTGTDITCDQINNLDNPPVICPISDGQGRVSMSFETTLGVQQRVEYYLDDTDHSIKKVTENMDGTNESEGVSLTSPEVEVTSLKFFVDGSDPTDNKQPSVIIIVSGVASTGDQSTPFTIQTYVSQRTIE